ncbi:MAG: hypothetical protein ACKVT0_18120 [Planctomycetaceae bacterium]
MAKSTRRRSQKKIALMANAMIWGAGLFGGCLLGAVVMVMPWGTELSPLPLHSTSQPDASRLVDTSKSVSPPVSDSKAEQASREPPAVIPESIRTSRPGGAAPVASKTKPTMSFSNPNGKSVSRRLISPPRSEKPSIIAKSSNHRPKNFVNPRSRNAVRPANQGETTLAYWNEINSIIEQEQQLRSVPHEGLTAANAQEFLSRRSQSGEFAVQALSGLNSKGVDPEVLALTKSLRDWYAVGVRNAKTGENLLAKADEKSRKGAPGQRWKSSELEHGKAVERINQSAGTLRKKLIQKYKLDFPPLR